MSHEAKAQTATQDTIPPGTTRFKPKAWPISQSLVVQGDSLSRQSGQLSVDSLGYVVLSEPSTTPLIINYQAFPEALTKSYQLFVYDSVAQRLSLANRPFFSDADPTSTQNPSGIQNGLNRSGALSRGITLGNNQSLVLNSGLNLQLNGKLDNDVDVTAVLTDNAVPFQPDGTTQQIQDFDRVYVQVSRKQTSLLFGDYDLAPPPINAAPFLVAIKSVRGVRAKTGFSVAKLPTTHQLNIASSRGRFQRMAFIGQEGVQGPYRLRGVENETFIVVMASSERVYIDGVLQTRGEQNDYIIDYNQGEIRFMPRRLITGQSRIIIEFEYAVRAYARGMVSYSAGAQLSKKWAVSAGIFSEADFPNQPLQLELSDEAKRVLQRVGDSVQQAQALSASTAEFNPNEVLYALRDSAGLRFFQVNLDSTISSFRVSFAFVGEGRGDYLQPPSTLNGRVFRYVAPIISPNGDTVRQGSFTPFTTIPAPGSYRQIHAGVAYQSDSLHAFTLNLSESKRDINLFSSLSNEDNVGYAAQGRGVRSLSKTNATVLEARFEHLTENFRTYQPHRAAEFARNWALPALYTFENETLGALQLRQNASKTKRLNAEASISGFLAGEEYQGARVGLGLKLKPKTLNQREVALFKADALSAKSYGADVFFGRGLAQSNVSLQKWTLQPTLGLEHSQSLVNNVLNARSFSFQYGNLTLALKDTADFGFRVQYLVRHDAIRGTSNLSRFEPGQLAQTLTLTTQRVSATQRLSLSLNARTAKRFQDVAMDSATFQSLAGQVEYGYTPAQSWLAAQGFLSYAAAQEPRRDQAYVAVPKGQGTHIWRDYNDNGVQELAEFELAPFRDQADFVRVFTLSNTYVPTFSTSANATITAEGARFKKKPKWVGKLSTLTYLALERRTQSDNIGDQLNPLLKIGSDSSLQTETRTLRNALYFNRTNPSSGAELAIANILSNNFLTSGLEGRARREVSLRVRKQWSPVVLTELLFAQTINQVTNQLFITRNYSFTRPQATPKISIFVKSSSRLTFQTELIFAEGQAQTEDVPISASLTQVSPRLEFQTNALGKGLVTSSVSLISNRFSGVANSPLGFDLLQGLQPGRNWLWSLQLQRNLGKDVQVSVGYDGRSSQVQTITSNAETTTQTRLVHVGRMQARWLF